MNQRIIGLQQNPIINESMNRIKPQTNQSSVNFGDVLKNALNNVSKIENESDFKTTQLALGKDIELHDVMISAQKAAVTIEATVQIQQKVIDAYNEVMRMQV